MYKKTLILTFILFLGSVAQAQQFRRAIDYMNFISRQQVLIVKSSWRYTQAMAHSKNDRVIDKKRTILISSIDRAVSKITKAQGFEGDTIYKGKVLNNLEINKSLLLNDYAEIVDMQEVANQSYDAMEAYILAQELADKKMEEAQKEYEENFYAYAKKYDIEILEGQTELGKKMEISNKVFDYHNDLSLIFYKVYFNEGNMLEAIGEKNISGIQQNMNALQSSLKEGLKEVDEIPLYKKDSRIAKAIKEVFVIYQDEIDTKIPSILEYLVLEEDLVKINNALEKTEESKRTSAQIDNYNSKLEQLNTKREAINKLIEKLFKERNKKLERLDAANAKFLDKHVPKYTI